MELDGIYLAFMLNSHLENNTFVFFVISCVFTNEDIISKSFPV